RFRSRLGRAPLRETQHLGTMLGLASLDPIYECTPRRRDVARPTTRAAETPAAPACWRTWGGSARYCTWWRCPTCAARAWDLEISLSVGSSALARDPTPRDHVGSRFARPDLRMHPPPPRCRAAYDTRCRNTGSPRLLAYMGR